MGGLRCVSWDVGRGETVRPKKKSETGTPKFEEWSFLLLILLLFFPGGELIRFRHHSLERFVVEKIDKV